MSDANEVAAADPIRQVERSVGILKTVMEIADKSPELKVAGTNVAKTAKTITSLVNNCLLPIAAVNFAFDKGKEYFSRKFAHDLGEVTKEIPVENLVEPIASLAAPILQGLTFSCEEETIKSMYLKLLGSSMDDRISELAHPAFVDVIRQINSKEARILQSVLRIGQIPIVQIRKIEGQVGAFRILSNHILNFNNQETKMPAVDPMLPAMVDNWHRLGLVSVGYTDHFTDLAMYSWVENRPEYIAAKAEQSDQLVTFEKGIMRVTAFGAQFSRVVL